MRDREVLNTRLTKLIADLPPELVRGPVEAEVTKILARERDVATQRLNEAMGTALPAPGAAAARLEDRTAAQRGRRWQDKLRPSMWKGPAKGGRSGYGMPKATSTAASGA